MAKEKYNAILELAKSTSKRVGELERASQDPVDVDIVKTVKAMFYEQVLEILKKGGKNYDEL